MNLKEWALKNDTSLLEAWDYEKNIDIDIEKVGYKSSKVAIWICPKGHHYPAMISKKVIGHRCIYCTNRALLKGYNDLQTMYPDIAREWDYGNNDRNPSDIKACENYVAHWKCQLCGYSWKTNVKNRIYNNTGCPKCSKEKSIENRRNIQVAKTGGLERNYPLLFADWDYELNKEVNPYSVNLRDKRKFWWKCREEEHSYEATISHRISNEACVYCSNSKLLIGFNDVRTKKEYVIDEWDYEKNSILPENLIYTDRKNKVHWKCRFCGDDIFSAPAYHNVPGCMKCRAIQKHYQERLAKTAIGNSLQQNQYIYLKDDWDFKKNEKEGLYWEQITPTYTKPVNWKCHVCGYSWKTSVYRRTKEGNGCPACRHLVVHSGYNDLATEAPELVEEWSPKNVLKPTEVIAGGIKNYLWVCRYCGNEWKASIHNRRVEGSNCPKCRGTNTSFAEQAIYFYFKKIFVNTVNRYIDPENGKELDIYVPELKLGIEYDGYRYHKDKLDSDDQKTQVYFAKGIKIIHIRETDAQGNKLPQLQIQPYRCFEYEYLSKFSGLDKIIKEMLTLFNADKAKVDTYADRFSILHNMYQGLRNNSFGESGSTHIKYWDYDTNYPLLPTEISKGSQVDINWKCPDCGHKWIRTIPNELKSKGCPQCAKTSLSSLYNLATESPEIVEEWNVELNEGILPTNIMPNTHVKYWWNCPICGKSFKASPPVWKKTRRCNNCGIEQGRKNRCKRVGQYTKEGKLIRIFGSAREADRETGVSYKKISQVCRSDKQKHAGGFIWKFEE